MGSGAMSLYAKARMFKIICNDISEISYITGKALIEDNRTKISCADIDRLFVPNPNNAHFIEKNFVPDVFMKRHAEFLDKALLNADDYLDKYLLIKYILYLRPYSKFSSPNAFNRPMEEGRFDKIKQSYVRHIENNFKPTLKILWMLKDKINAAIFTNNEKNEVYKLDVFDFIDRVSGDILYLDPPYSNTVLQNLPKYSKGILSVCFLLPRHMTRRPWFIGRSAARGISTGVHSRRTSGTITITDLVFVNDCKCDNNIKFKHICQYSFQQLLTLAYEDEYKVLDRILRIS